MQKIYVLKEPHIVPNNIYVDTNIIIDICDNTRPFYSDSLETIIAYQKDGCELYVNSDTYANLFYILRARSKLGLENTLSKMRLITTIFTLVSIESNDVANALHLCEDPSTSCKDYEDTMQYICAKKIEADLILTNDKGFVNLDIEIKKII